MPYSLCLFCSCRLTLCFSCRLSLWIACCLLLVAFAALDCLLLVCCFLRSLCLTGVPFRLASDYEKKEVNIIFYIVAKILEHIYPDIDIYIFIFL
jgi:apolipoprotein N-acyltransferase